MQHRNLDLGSIGRHRPDSRGKECIVYAILDNRLSDLHGR